MIRTLNSLRFILILMIVISHSTLPISQDLINYLGEFPVAIFFVISGFVLSLSKGEKLQKEVKFYPFPYYQTLSSSYSDSRHSHINGLAIRAYITMVSDSIPFAVDTNLVSGTWLYGSSQCSYMVYF